MRDGGPVRGVLFDAGGVLTRPIGGRWNPRHDFESIVTAHHPDVRPDLFPAAIDAGQRFLDAWAGLEATFAGLDIEHYFAGFAISEVLGCRKPDPRMYAEGSRLLGLQPHECLFIDDDPALVAAAEALGYRGLTLDRDAEPPTPAGVITCLDELVPVVIGGAR
ncbi:HAD-IA family hydrolase [Dactylosporangium sp. NPDC049525]|uniref:HAD family hydrolase n=1 Tax=Dactylosporangium sp. NPDC049525 TaxID=3154730 RepID=UPI00342620AD